MWNFLEIAVGQIWVQEQFELLYNILLFTLSFTRCVYQFIRNGVSMLITHSLKGGCLTCIVQLILQRPAVTGLVLVLTIEIYRSQGRTVASREISTLRNCPAGLLMLAQPEQASKVSREIARLWNRAVRLWDCEILRLQMSGFGAVISSSAGRQGGKPVPEMGLNGCYQVLPSGAT